MNVYLFFAPQLINHIKLSSFKPVLSKSVLSKSVFSKFAFFIVTFSTIFISNIVLGDDNNIVVTDPRLAKPIKAVMLEAYNYNKDLAAERENVKIAKNNLYQTLTQFAPKATASQEHGRDEVLYRGVSASSGVKNIATNKTLDVNLPLFNGFSSFNEYRREKQNLEAAKARLKSKQQEILLSSVQAYMDVVQEHDILELLKQKQKTLQKYYEDTDYKFQLGDVTQTDVAQANSRLIETNINVASEQGRLEASKYFYKKIVGTLPHALYLDVADPIKQKLSQDKFIEMALTNNPTIILAKYNIEAASYDIKSKYGALLPSLSLNASKVWREGGYLGTGFNNFSEKKLMLNASVPLFAGGANALAISRARIGKQHATYTLEEQNNIVVETTVQAFNQYQVALDSIKANQDNVKITTKALEGVKHEVAVGVRTTLELLNQEEEFYSAQIALLRSKHDHIVGAYNLLSQIGKLEVDVGDGKK